MLKERRQTCYILVSMLDIIAHAGVEHTDTYQASWHWLSNDRYLLLSGGLVWLLALTLKGFSPSEKLIRSLLVALISITLGLFLAREHFFSALVFVNAGFAFLAYLTMRKIFNINQQKPRGN